MLLRSLRLSIVQLVLGALAATLLVVAASGPAGAHAEVLEADPAIGGLAPSGLDELELRFIAMDPEGPVEVEVRDPDGNDRVAGEPRVEGDVVIVPLEPLAAGVHEVAWSVLASDGDGTSIGGFTFTVEEPAGGGYGIWLVWIVALAIPAAIFLRPGARKGGAKGAS